MFKNLTSTQKYIGIAVILLLIFVGCNACGCSNHRVVKDVPAVVEDTTQTVTPDTLVDLTQDTVNITQ